MKKLNVGLEAEVLADRVRENVYLGLGCELGGTARRPARGVSRGLVPGPRLCGLATPLPGSLGLRSPRRRVRTRLLGGPAGWAVSALTY